MSGPYATGLDKVVIDALVEEFGANYQYAEPPANDDVLIEGFAAAIARVAIETIEQARMSALPKEES